MLNDHTNAMQFALQLHDFGLINDEQIKAICERLFKKSYAIEESNRVQFLLQMSAKGMLSDEQTKALADEIIQSLSAAST